ncbi:MAG: hypothetical protein ACE5I9_08535 [Candidatus Methylomirabilales bacterium]
MSCGFTFFLPELSRVDTTKFGPEAEFEVAVDGAVAINVTARRPA